MNCSLLPQNENNALALGRLTQGPSHIFNSDQRAKKQSLATRRVLLARIQLSCFVVCLLRCAKLLILAYGALRLQVKWPHSQICQITWKHKPNDTLRNDLGKSDGQLYQERLILRLYSCLFINAKLYYKLTALNFTLLGFHGNVSQNGVMYNMWNGLHLHVILWENELPLINGAKSTW